MYPWKPEVNSITYKPADKFHLPLKASVISFDKSKLLGNEEMDVFFS